MKNLPGKNWTHRVSNSVRGKHRCTRCGFGNSGPGPGAGEIKLNFQNGFRLTWRYRYPFSVHLSFIFVCKTRVCFNRAFLSVSVCLSGSLSLPTFSVARSPPSFRPLSLAAECKLSDKHREHSAYRMINDIAFTFFHKSGLLFARAVAKVFRNFGEQGASRFTERAFGDRNCVCCRPLSFSRLRHTAGEARKSYIRVFRVLLYD